MSDRHPVTNDPDRALVFELVDDSPHVFAYKVWLKRPGEDDWSDPGCEGDTDPDTDAPSSSDLGPLPDGTKLDIPVAVGGESNAPYRGRAVFRQGGEPVTGGEIELDGTTSDDGGGAEFVRVVLT